MNLLGAKLVSKSVAISTERLTWDSSNCKGNMSLISYQLYLLIPSGYIVMVILTYYTTFGFHAK